mmetsp:Transcript_96731/g.141504  ORF Transcript_96731/g.141504 Transcript_96731/m.141504 type:complete len:304 (+) Transcript_96731:1263-2174(+)
MAIPCPIREYLISCRRCIGGRCAQCSRSATVGEGLTAARFNQYRIVQLSCVSSIPAAASEAGFAHFERRRRTIAVPSRTWFVTASVNAVVLSPIFVSTRAPRSMRSRVTRSRFFATAYAKGVRPSSLTSRKQTVLTRSGSPECLASLIMSPRVTLSTAAVTALTNCSMRPVLDKSVLACSIFGFSCPRVSSKSNGASVSASGPEAEAPLPNAGNLKPSNGLACAWPKTASLSRGVARIASARTAVRLCAVAAEMFCSSLMETLDAESAAVRSASSSDDDDPGSSSRAPASLVLAHASQTVRLG